MVNKSKASFENTFNGDNFATEGNYDSNNFKIRGIFLASRCTSLLLCSKPVQRNYRHFFQRFQTEGCILRVNKSKLLVNTILMEIIWQLQIAMIKLKTKKHCFGYFARFVVCGLTLQIAKSVYLLFFSNIVWILRFLCHFLLVLEAGSKLTAFHTKFFLKAVVFWRLDVLVLCCTANQYSKIAGILLGISNRRARSKG